MNSGQDDFEALRKLMALKKHEQPPPGYFNQLPRKIWARIEIEENQPTFWERLFPTINLKPAFAYAFGLAACGTLFVGINYSLKNDQAPALTQPLSEDPFNYAFPVTAQATQEIRMISLAPSPSHDSSTNPVINSEPLPSLFDGMKLQVQPASYQSAP